MDNALGNARFLNFSIKTDVPLVDCKLSSSNNSPDIRRKGMKREEKEDKMGLEQRVLWWFCQKGIRRGDPCSHYDHFKEGQRKRIVSERENMNPGKGAADAKSKPDATLLNRRLMRRLTVQA
jgi:hypothetical protein